MILTYRSIRYQRGAYDLAGGDYARALLVQVPAPAPPGAAQGPDRINLGTKDTMGVTDDPALGGRWGL